MSGKQDKVNQVNFYKLTPAIIKKDYDNYQAALDYAYREDDVLNIALTGTYGAGKSSIWKTYKTNKKWNNKDCIQVSLANFRKDQLDINSPSEKISGSLSQIEVQILNQILYQVDENKIPSSKYRVKKPSTFFKTMVKLYPWIMIILFLFIIFLEPSIIKLIKPNLNTIQAAWANISLAIVLLLIPVLLLVGRISKIANLKLKTISFHGTQVEVDKEEGGIPFR